MKPRLQRVIIAVFPPCRPKKKNPLGIRCFITSISLRDSFYPLHFSFYYYCCAHEKKSVLDISKSIFFSISIFIQHGIVSRIKGIYRIQKFDKVIIDAVQNPSMKESNRTLDEVFIRIFIRISLQNREFSLIIVYVGSAGVTRVGHDPVYGRHTGV